MVGFLQFLKKPVFKAPVLILKLGRPSRHAALSWLLQLWKAQPSSQMSYNFIIATLVAILILVAKLD